VLGARALPTDHGALPWFELGAITVTLCPNADQPSPAVFGTHATTMLWLEVDDLGAAHAHLRAHGVAIDDFHAGEYMHVRDPDGIVIEIWQRES
jgi:catechol 2,3-dioxygenase-like lactoylglutathione lyase family enzyme